MTTADDLLRRALESLNDREAQLKELGCGCLAARALEEDIRAYLDAPKDEPIGYVFQYSDGALGSDIYYTPEEAVEYTEGEGIGVPVYLHPPAKTAPKKPMTEEELADCIPSQPKGGMFHMVDGRLGVTKEWLIPLVRAIERHHGITGDNE